MIKYIYFIIDYETGQRVTELIYRKSTARLDGRRYYKQTGRLYHLWYETDTPEGRQRIADRPTAEYIHPSK